MHATVQSFHFAPQCPVDSPHFRPGPVSATRVEEVEMNPRPACPVPSTSSSLSVVNCISSWEQRAAQDSRQSYHSPSTPTRTQSPAGPSASQARRRAVYLAREEDEANFPSFDLDLFERSYRVSVLATGRSMRWYSENWCLLWVLCRFSSPPLIRENIWHSLAQIWVSTLKISKV